MGRVSELWGGRKKDSNGERRKFVTFPPGQLFSIQMANTLWEISNTNIFSSGIQLISCLYTIRARMGEYSEQYSKLRSVPGKACQKAEHLRIFKTLSPYQSIQTYFG